jgi:mannose/fructose/N-acetylgalactosamine-specific phosphotransferase system component IIC
MGLCEYKSYLHRNIKSRPFIVLSFIGGAMFVAQFFILISLMIYSYSKDLGAIGLDQVGNYSAAAFTASLIFAFLTIFAIVVGYMSCPYLIAWFITGFVTIAYMYLPFKYLSQSSIKQMKAIAAKNWRIEVEYVIFQARNSCSGLSAQQDKCGDNCCDATYIKQLDSRIKLCKTLLIISTILSIIKVLIFPGHELLYRCFY